MFDYILFMFIILHNTTGMSHLKVIYNVVNTVGFFFKWNPYTCQVNQVQHDSSPAVLSLHLHLHCIV